MNQNKPVPARAGQRDKEEGQKAREGQAYWTKRAADQQTRLHTH